MEATELLELISRGEDSHIKFIQAYDAMNSASLASEMVAFANGEGGSVLIGVDDVGKILGLTTDDIRRLNNLVSNVASGNVRPPINQLTKNISTPNGLVMVVDIRPGLSKPYADNQGVFWMKSGANKCQLIAHEELQWNVQSYGSVNADEVPLEGALSGSLDDKYFEKFFEKQYGQTIQSALKKSNISLIRLLNNIGLAKDKYLNLAGEQVSR